MINYGTLTSIAEKIKGCEMEKLNLLDQINIAAQNARIAKEAEVSKALNELNAAIVNLRNEEAIYYKITLQD